MKSRIDNKCILVIFGLLLVLQAGAQTSSSAPTNSRTNPRPDEAEAATKRAFSKGAAEGRINTIIRIKGAIRPICFIGVIGHTNMVAYRPLPSQAFDAHLFDSSGKVVSKTWAGTKFGNSLKVDHELLDLTVHGVEYVDGRTLLPRFGDYHIWDFDILKSFKIKEPGEYRLQVQVRLFVKDTNGVFQPFILPMVETNVIILGSDLGK